MVTLKLLNKNFMMSMSWTTKMVTQKLLNKNFVMMTSLTTEKGRS